VFGCEVAVAVDKMGAMAFVANRVLAVVESRAACGRPYYMSRTAMSFVVVSRL
jgi:hypothetical protein